MDCNMHVGGFEILNAKVPMQYLIHYSVFQEKHPSAVTDYSTVNSNNSWKGGWVGISNF